MLELLLKAGLEPDREMRRKPEQSRRGLQKRRNTDGGNLAPDKRPLLEIIRPPSRTAKLRRNHWDALTEISNGCTPNQRFVIVMTLIVLLAIAIITIGLGGYRAVMERISL